MDKVKIFLAVAKKHQFWIFCGVMLLTALGCWWLSTAALAAQYNTRKKQIEDDFTGTNINSDHANDATIADVTKKDEALKEKVYRAWVALYAEQQKNNPFPHEILGKQFEQQFRGLDLGKPLEKQQENPKDPKNPKNQINDNFREMYRNYIDEYLPGLEKIIDALHVVGEPEGAHAGGGAPGGSRPGGALGGPGFGGLQPGAGGRGPRGPAGVDGEKKYTGIVEWDLDQVKPHFSWRETPSTLDVVLAQEDLWVYQALLRVIARVNDGATTQANAAIKRIDSLEIGRDTVRAWNDLNEKESVWRSGQGAGQGGMMGPGKPGEGLGGVAQGGSGNSPERALFEGRYIDDKGASLPFESEYPFVKHTYLEYKMMPVRLVLFMDQRRLPKLFVACANSSMPIEVRRLRILKTASTSSPGGPMGPAGGRMGGPGMGIGPGMGAGMGPGMGPAMGPGMGAAMGPGMGAGMGPGAARPKAPAGGVGAGGLGPNPAQDDASPFDAPVEIYAVIYIYNPPDATKLGITVKNPADAAAPSGAAAPAPSGTGPATPTPPATPAR
jgi:hypothetical protein